MAKGWPLGFMSHVEVLGVALGAGWDTSQGTWWWGSGSWVGDASGRSWVTQTLWVKRDFLGWFGVKRGRTDRHSSCRILDGEIFCLVLLLTHPAMMLGGETIPVFALAHPISAGRAACPTPKDLGASLPFPLLLQDATAIRLQSHPCHGQGMVLTSSILTFTSSGSVDQNNNAVIALAPKMSQSGCFCKTCPARARVQPCISSTSVCLRSISST